ncbi:sortilin-related receptor-like [Condylostylus longicornis]|uniref:sortilin-related receptor-like n=1 Tax=Condylostylus longicornis TaxID=2530218 RepID=UPI00244DC4F1|nr:sortilin-related receptor-like [Condylostylus longicornis]
MPKSWQSNFIFDIITIFLFFNLIILNLPKKINCVRYGDKPTLLHVDLKEERDSIRKPFIISRSIENNNNENSDFNIYDKIEKFRHKRDATLSNPNTSGNAAKTSSASSVSATATSSKSSTFSSASTISNIETGGGGADGGSSNTNGGNVGLGGGKTTTASTIKPPLNDGNKHQHRNITVKTNHLNDSHAQLMVHWLGDGSDVMICLARDPPPGPNENTKLKEDASPSSVYISYDYGDTFENKTHLFTVPGENGTEKNSTLDQFLTHPKYDTIIFIDSRNKVIFNVPEKGDNVTRYLVDFTPSDISFYESDPKTFLALDKEDPDRKLYYTTDCGKTFTMLEMYVKSFSWSSGDYMPAHLYVERKEPITNTSSVRWINAADLLKPNINKSFNVLIENVQDFHIKKDFMFAMRKVLNTTELHISYKRGKFVKAIFQTELDIKAMHIADVEGRRIMISAAHSEYISHLYVSESNNDMTDIKFVPSLENIFTYIPDVMWKQGWLSQTTDETFTDLYKVEGIRGIYIASKVHKSQLVSFLQQLSRYAYFESVGPANLVSLISFDHGASWKRIEAPKYDDEGQAILNCTKDCSLHLSQKLSQLYPVTRAVSIMSSKLAPGVIMASGVIGKSLKGHPGVFLSRDAGLTWSQILKTYHFFNFGDHGGILVAVKYYKSKGETREILYTTDEGENWERYSFHEEDLKIYGLMTEPNSNTTIFTLFGSQTEEHQWLILKIDLQNAFERNCSKKTDYKFWAPSSQDGTSLMPCQLGKQQKFQRRAPRSNCYNGKDFEPQIITDICLCNAWDFECDFGFTRLNSNSPCTFNKSIQHIYDPYKIPNYCRPGGYYNRTRGYRKIEGDVCYGGYETRYLPQSIPCPMKQTPSFLLVAQRDRISRIDINTQTREEIPVQDLKNVIAIDYDIKNNCVFFADIMSDKIGRQCLDGNHTTEILVDSDLSSVEGMSYDWVSELLFFVDGTRSKIEAVKTSRDGLARLRTTIIDYEKLVKPRGIVVHPLEGLLFWTEWSTQKPSLSRSNLDGTDIIVLFSKPDVVWPNGVTIDYFSQRIYWVDASRDYIGSCDLNGKSFAKILEHDSRVAHPFAVAIYKDLMYWDDWKMNSIYSADKDHGIMIKNIAHQMSNLMDLKVYAHSLQEGTNGCEKSNCSHICVGAPKGGYSCLCPVGMTKSGNECLCPDGLRPFNNNTCAQQGNTCIAGFFKCDTVNICIPNSHRCDGHDDCGDNSDEKGCATENPPCPHYMFRCKIDNKCIPEYFVCDSDIDCDDGSDELGCKFNDCKDTEFKCNNGRCISDMWVCDGEDDCIDKSDEQNCRSSNKTAVTCKPDEFRCASNNQCVPIMWKCDNDYDCPDGSDETNCNRRECDMWEFDCGNGKCIYRTWRCDGDRDCENNADEINCTKSAQPVPGTTFFPSNACHDWMFKCSNDKCIPMWWKCDSANDCGDNSDEIGCSTTQNSTNRIGTKTTISPKYSGHQKCAINYFQCNSGDCILKKYVCDGASDCLDGEDESNCSNITVEACNGPNQFRCRSDRTCLPMSMYCDHIQHCVDNSDEEDCGEHPSRLPDHEVSCGPAYFRCDHTCIPLMKRCDSKLDCYDGSDEETCQNVKRVYQVTNFIIDPKFVEQTSFVLSWWVILSPETSVTLEYLPSISLVDKNNWKNATWITDKKYKFRNLTPYTNYNCTVYVRVKGEHPVPPFFFANITTSEGIPDHPLNVNVTQIGGSRVQVTWDPPKKTYGPLIAYTVYYRPQSMSIGSAQSVKVNSQDHSLILDSFFKSNITYEFWVRAKNSKEESLPSKMVQLTINDISNIDSLQGLTVSISDSGYDVTLKWVPVKGADGYLIDAILPQPYPRIPSKKVNETEIKFDNLAPGISYIFKVAAYVKQFVGRAQPIKVSLKSPALPEVANIHLENDSSYTRLKWIEPKTTLKNITYGVYYGTTEEETFEGPKIKTQLTEANITDLMPCQSYMISVGIVGPLGPGPLSHDPIAFETTLNDRKPPRNLIANVDRKTRKMTIEWDHNCALSKVFPAYLITVIETVKNQTSAIEIKRAANKTIHYSHYFNDVPYGAVYNISIRSKVDNSEPANIVVDAPKLEGPRQLKVWPEGNGTYVVYWKEFEKSHYDFKFTYELVIYDGHYIHEVENNATEIKRISSNTPPILVNPDDLGGLHALGRIFTFGIRLKSDAGYTSDISEIEHIEVPVEAWHLPVVSDTTYAWLIIIPIILIIALGGVIVYLVQRHRRLQNSFSRFANSHYDTKTGATRIGTDVFDDDHHEHHQEVPRFADDDPLVI